MKANFARKRTPRSNILGKRLLTVVAMLTVVSIATLASIFTAYAQNGSAYFLPGNLVVTRSVYVDTGSIIAGTTVLPPNCSPANCPTPATAVTSSAYPYVFNNDTVDGNFGITSKIFLDQITPFGYTRHLARGAQQLRKTECRPPRIKWSPASPQNRNWR